MSLKLDMSKTYDHVEWKFLQAVVDKMSFHLGRTDLILKCITYVLYPILINGIQVILDKVIPLPIFVYSMC